MVKGWGRPHTFYRDPKNQRQKTHISSIFIIVLSALKLGCGRARKMIGGGGGRAGRKKSEEIYREKRWPYPSGENNIIALSFCFCSMYIAGPETLIHSLFSLFQQPGKKRYLNPKFGMREKEVPNYRRGYMFFVGNYLFNRIIYFGLIFLSYSKVFFKNRLRPSSYLWKLNLIKLMWRIILRALNFRMILFWQRYLD